MIGCPSTPPYSDTQLAVRIASCASWDMCYRGKVKMLGCAHMKVFLPSQSVSFVLMCRTARTIPGCTYL